MIEKTLAELTLNITDGKHGDCRGKDDSGFYFISCKDVRDGQIHYEDARQIVEEDFWDAHKRTRLEPDDILVTNSGTIGRMAFIRDVPLTYRTTFQKSVTIPVVFEVQNTSNTTRVIRDVSLLLYSENKFVGKMFQSSGKHITTRTGGEVTGTQDYSFGAEKGSYSFVLPPRSIQRQECEYCYVIYPKEREEKVFDTVIARYYDERNKAHTFKVMNIDKVWTKEYFDPDEDWCMLEEKVVLPSY